MLHDRYGKLTQKTNRRNEFDSEFYLWDPLIQSLDNLIMFQPIIVLKVKTIEFNQIDKTFEQQSEMLWHI